MSFLFICLTPDSRVQVSVECKGVNMFVAAQFTAVYSFESVIVTN